MVTTYAGQLPQRRSRPLYENQSKTTAIKTKRVGSGHSFLSKTNPVIRIFSSYAKIRGYVYSFSQDSVILQGWRDISIYIRISCKSPATTREGGTEAREILLLWPASWHSPELWPSHNPFKEPLAPKHAHPHDLAPAANNGAGTSCHKFASVSQAANRGSVKVNCTDGTNSGGWRQPNC